MFHFKLRRGETSEKIMVQAKSGGGDNERFACLCTEEGAREGEMKGIRRADAEERITDCGLRRMDVYEGCPHPDN